MPTCCGRQFSTNGMRNHLDNSSSHANELECGWCYARWPSGHAGSKKRRLEHEQREHWLSCKDCSCIFMNDDKLSEHRESAHPPNYCEQCKRRFQSLNHLNQVSLGY